MAVGKNSPAVELVKLQSSEGETFEVPIEVVKVSRTLSIMLAGTGMLMASK